MHVFIAVLHEHATAPSARDREMSSNFIVWKFYTCFQQILKILYLVLVDSEYKATAAPQLLG